MYHMLDSVGDVILVLRSPNEEFAYWDEDEEYRLGWPITLPNEAEGILGNAEEDRRKRGKKWKKGLRERSMLNGTAASSPDLVEPNHISKSAAGDKAVQFAAAEPICITPDSSPQPEMSAAPAPEDETIQCYVSSRHLVLASKYFKRKLTPCWKEDYFIVDAGKTTMELVGWDADALLIVLNIIHGHARAVPRSISLEMMAKVAVIVDYLQCLEVVELFTIMWFQNLKSMAEVRYGRELVLWTLVCAVFQQSEKLIVAARIMVEQSPGPVQSMVLPMPEMFIEYIDNRRQESIDRMLASLDELSARLLSGNDTCSPDCSSILLGTLSKEMHKRELSSPRPERPYLGLTLAKLFEGIRQFRKPDWMAVEPSLSYGYLDRHECSLQSHLEPTIKDIQRQLGEMTLQDLTPRASETLNNLRD